MFGQRGDNLPDLIKPHYLQHSFHSVTHLPAPFPLSTVYPRAPIQLKSKHPPKGNVKETEELWVSETGNKQFVINAF